MMENLITDWKWPGERPTSFGWYHLMWLAIMIVVTIVLCMTLAKKHNKKKDDIVIFSFGFMLIALEIYKQIFYTLDAGYYQWHAFPFQFCSVPMFVAFIAPLLKDGKVKDAMYKFLAYFGLLAGLAVMTYPGNCFATSYVTILIHTMIWHSSMVIMGIYLHVSKQYGKNILKEVIPGFIVFSVILLIAFSANMIGYHAWFKNPDLNVFGQQLNLFYISPYYSCSLPILSNIKEHVPYVVFLGSYLLAFFLGVTIIFGIFKGIRMIKLTSLNMKRKSIKTAA